MVDLEFLASIPVFTCFTRAELAAAAPLFREVQFAKDDVVIRIGEPGDTFYVVLDGELSVWGAGDPPRQTGSLRRGDSFGEMALLQGGTRTATVTAGRLTTLLAVDKPTFDRVFLTNPKAIEYFARVLSKRLAGLTRAEQISRGTTTVSVASPHGLRGETLTAWLVAALLREQTQTEVVCVQCERTTDAPAAHVLDLTSLTAGDAGRHLQPGTEVLPASLHVVVPTEATSERLGTLMSALVAQLSERFSFIVLDLGASQPPLMASAPAFSDVYIALVNAPDDGIGVPDPRSMKVHRVINRINPSSHAIPISSSAPFVVPVDEVLALPTPQVVAYVCRHPRSAAALPFRRLVHRILGTSVGLALGGGAAFGLAHLGVLQVLEAGGIEVDVVAGCSQGSIIAIGYAAGLSVAEMIEIARELGDKRNFLTASDPTFFTKPGLLSGQKFLSMLRPYLRGKETFEELILPCQTVATDIQSGERVALRAGRLETAFRASSSVPMVMAPVLDGERVLVDGGVADPVPAEVVQAMGADIVVATNVVPPMKRGVETAMSQWYRRVNAFNPLNYFAPDAQDMPNLFDIVMNSMQILQYELGNFKAISADVLINPDLSDFTWVEYYRADELIARGADAASHALPRIQKAIAAKILPIQSVAPGQRGATPAS